MLHSLAAQVSYYSDLIQKHPGWRYAGVYADEERSYPEHLEMKSPQQFVTTEGCSVPFRLKNLIIQLHLHYQAVNTESLAFFSTF